MTQIIFHPYAPGDASDVGRDVSHDAIERRAREIWLAKGCPSGCDLAIWLEAEAELVAIHEKRFRHPQLPMERQAA